MIAIDISGNASVIIVNAWLPMCTCNDPLASNNSNCKYLPNFVSRYHNDVLSLK